MEWLHGITFLLLGFEQCLIHHMLRIHVRAYATMCGSK